jgi:serine/threonine-protein kinase
MGAVWAATHTVTGKAVALKFLLGAGDDPGMRERLLREARAVCAVMHPNVVPVHDVLELEGGAPALVMDILSGESLSAKLVREGTLPQDEVVRIAIDVLSALEAAHARGIIHRDLKPDNIFLARTPGSKVDDIKVLDFGIAKVTTLNEGDAQAAALTRTDAMVGTPYYMAPEQVYGEKDIDPRSDLWSIGIVLYECLAGVRPTEGTNLGQIFKLVTIGPIPSLAEKAPHVSPSLAKLVGWCLERSRENRPKNATELREALERVRAGSTMDGAEVIARPVESAPQPKRSLRMPMVAAAVVLALASGSAFAFKARSDVKATATARAQAERARAQVEADARARAESEAQPKVEAEARAKAESEALAKAESEALAVPDAGAAPAPKAGVRGRAKAAPGTAPAAASPKDERAAGKVVVTPPY